LWDFLPAGLEVSAKAPELNFDFDFIENLNNTEISEEVIEKLYNITKAIHSWVDNKEEKTATDYELIRLTKEIEKLLNTI